MKRLFEPAFVPVSLREIRPEGWLRRQLRIQAEGLSGHLDLFWNDIKNSAWIGGSADGWERMPYWLDGFIPLAWLLDDEELKGRAGRYVEAILGAQEEDGWICPSSENRDRYDVWPMFLILKVLVLYEDAGRDPRVQPAVRRALRALERHIDGHTLFDWAQTRYFEALIPIFWLYDRQPEEWLLALARKLTAQGFDWQGLFRDWPYEKSEGKGRWSQMSHVVNNAMMLKSGALKWRMTGREEDRKAPYEMLKLLDECHGTVTGVFTGDECLAGKSPVQGTELCVVAEFMYSAEQLLRITGDPYWGDRLEKAAFNALPAALSPDMWSHQYDQQVNQVQCRRMENPPFNTNGPDSNRFGLEPNFGCCTANFNQAWPKFAASVFMKSADGLAVAAYAPSSVRTEINGLPVEVRLDTEYPFRQELTFTVFSRDENTFSLFLRIPGWAERGIITVGGKTIFAGSGTFHRIRRVWKGETRVRLTLPMEPALIPRPNGLYAVGRGPLVYALPIEEKWVKAEPETPGHEFPHCDYEVLPVSAWNYGLCADPGDAGRSLRFTEKPLGSFPFSPQEPPVVCTAEGKKIDWKLVGDCAEPSPSMAWVSGGTERLNLIPYGCTNLRMTELPLV